MGLLTATLPSNFSPTSLDWWSFLQLKVILIWKAHRKTVPFFSFLNSAVQVWQHQVPLRPSALWLNYTNKVYKLSMTTSEMSGICSVFPWFCFHAQEIQWMGREKPRCAAVPPLDAVVGHRGLRPWHGTPPPTTGMGLAGHTEAGAARRGVRDGCK